ncbi:TonB-dependent receptor plug domain-containing protein [Spartinivicinus poritis]|uniref:TonB-dependent receptor n=1 Tax=Spartinivicinus poritis TaxID=2994640 RepID=A0ABT5U3L8_9GAMM|nr:TonB-dependent receptor [Spartinivicinus sp. A2-2]MDE1460958.1 TonB-dependent receptor [Spartinivicinus sp. A2-2]
MPQQLSMPNAIHYLVFCIVFILITPLSASEAEQPLEDLLTLELEELMMITVVSKREESIENAPGIVTIISSDEIQKFGGRNLRDILNRQINMMIVGNHIFQENQVSLRAALNGLLDNQVLYLLNGRPLTNSQGQGVHMDLYLNFPIAIIEQIEIVRGPGSVLYGTNAFAGIINIKTKQPSESFSPLLSLTGGSYDTKSASFTQGNTFDKFSFITAIHVTDFNGDQDINYQDAFGNTDSYPAGGNGLGLVSNATYDNLNFNMYLGQATRNNLGAVILFPEHEATVKHLTFDIGYQYDFNQNWYLKTNYAFYKDWVDFTSNFDLSNHPEGLDTEVNSDLYSFELNLLGSINDQTNLLAGINPLYSDGNSSEGATNGKWNTWQASAYMQVDHQLYKWLKIVGGIQLNKAKELDKDYSPRGGLIFDFDNGWYSKLLYGSAFRIANVSLRFFDGAFFQNNRDLKPETINTLDFQVGLRKPNYSFSTTYYMSKIKNSHIFEEVPNTSKRQMINSGSVDFEGIEIEGKWNLSNTINVVGNIAYQTNENSDDIKDSTFVPNLMVKLGISYKNQMGYSFSLFNSYFSEPTPLDKVAPAFSLNVNPKANSYNLLSANLALNLGKLTETRELSNIKVSFYIDNLLNKNIFFPNYATRNVSTFPNYQGRSVYGTVEISF